MTHDIMIDLETVGNRPGCGILSIGAVEFNAKTKKLGPELYVVVNKASCEAAGLTTQQSTMDWWEKQSPEARAVLEQAAKEDSAPLAKALSQLTEFLAGFGLKTVRVWGNGADFDNAILSCAYGALGQDCPWPFWNNRCYRTLKSLAPKTKLARSGVYHNALSDAKSQARHAIEILAAMNEIP